MIAIKHVGKITQTITSSTNKKYAWEEIKKYIITVWHSQFMQSMLTLGSSMHHKVTVLLSIEQQNLYTKYFSYIQIQLNYQCSLQLSNQLTQLFKYT
jgi:hypothetical protein